MKYEIVVGLEVHAELKTESKIFCGCSTHFGAEQNTNVCEVCLGMPGTLPVLNQRAVEFAIRAGLALNCEIATFSKFDRKNYYYPDLPKNYQISQYDLPVCTNGYLDVEVDGETKRIGITRIHLEEDAGKLVHPNTITTSSHAWVDYNRTGVPLVEIVSEPDIRTPEEARAYLTKLRSILEYCDVSDCKMEEGSLRCDANISLRPFGQTTLGTRTELKNMNSFKAVQKGLEYEAMRQEQVLEDGGRIRQETRTWDEAKGVTLSMRSKEQAHDYRYFPDPDLVPLEISRAQVAEIRQTLPELPAARKLRLVEQDGLPDYDAEVITASRAVAEYYDAVKQLVNDPKTIANWIMGDMMMQLNARNLSIVESPVSPAHLADMIQLLNKGTISGKIAKTVFDEMFESGKKPDEIVKEKGLVQISDESAIIAIVEEVLAANPQSVADYKAGKEKAIGFLVGQVMKQSKGRANPELANRLLKERL
jgi:aspartyl-tRNA(Asn)/glutamyl-tRNA(Gln) amidotransferase subunit B